MAIDNIASGMKVRVASRIGSTKGMMIKNIEDQKKLRKLNKGNIGTVWGYVPGHGGDVWWILLDGDLVAYSVEELEKA